MCWCRGHGYRLVITVKIDLMTGRAIVDSESVIELCPCQWRTV